MRPISNVVDVSNYVMLELNQPNHAYDLDTLGGGGFRVRLAAEGERLTTLDGEERTFTAADLFICDANDVPIGVGGIMGGLDTEISDSTTTIALEMAWFSLVGIGQTVTRTNLRSEASARFERGVDPYGMPTADRPIRRAAVGDLPRPRRARRCRRRSFRAPPGANTASPTSASARSTGSSAPTSPPTTSHRCSTRSASRCPGAGDVRSVVLPTWRLDSTEEVDVIEEVARHYGYDRIGKTVPKSVVHGELSVRQQRRRLVREVLLGLGISEAMPNPFLAPDTLAKAGLPAEALRITNPLVDRGERVAHIAAARPAPLGRLQRVASASRRGAVRDRSRVPAGRGRTAGRVRGAHRRARRRRGACGRGGLARDRGGARNRRDGSTSRRCPRVCMRPVRRRCRRDAIRSGPSARWLPTSWRRSRSPSGWRFSNSISTRSWTANPSRHSGSRSAGIRRATSTSRSSCPTTSRPSASRRPSGRAPASLLVDIDLFDVYRGERAATGTRSLAYRVRLQAADRNLTDADIADVRRGVEAAATKLGAQLRT